MMKVSLCCSFQLMLITESHDDDHGLLTMYDSTNDILIALEKKTILLPGYFRTIIEFS